MGKEIMIGDFSENEHAKATIRSGPDVIIEEI